MLNTSSPAQYVPGTPSLQTRLETSNQHSPDVSCVPDIDTSRGQSMTIWKNYSPSPQVLRRRQTVGTPLASRILRPTTVYTPSLATPKLKRGRSNDQAVPCTPDPKDSGSSPTLPSRAGPRQPADNDAKVSTPRALGVVPSCDTPRESPSARQVCEFFLRKKRMPASGGDRKSRRALINKQTDCAPIYGSSGVSSLRKGTEPAGKREPSAAKECLSLESVANSTGLLNSFNEADDIFRFNEEAEASSAVPL